MQRTQNSALVISSAGSETVLDAELENLRRITGAFRQETDLRMNAINGNHDELRAEVQSDVGENIALQQILDRYWSVRETAELADFDGWMAKSQETLAVLRENGHEITPAQEKLEEIITMRTALATALRTRNNAGIELAHKKIHATSVEYARMISTIRLSASSDNRLGQSIDQGIGVITRARMMNADLKQSGIDITDAENLVALGKVQILTAQEQVKNNETAHAKTSLAEFRITLRTLRDTYREILVQEDLSQTTAEGVLSVAQSLDVTAGQVGAC